MPSFKHSLLGIGKICDRWREQAGAKLWQFSLIPLHTISPPPPSHPPTALNAHDLPSVSALVHYLHAAAGFPVKSTWLAAIKAGNFASWPGLTYANASKFCPSSDETIQGLRSTKPKTRPAPSPTTTPASLSKELHIWSDPISKLFTDDI
eukprot:CCRYP_012494-RA/>CCRYP_012494-RA protein AED:0.42 eAED:0.42 QI:0/0/0/1/1/1/2/0/149